MNNKHIKEFQKIFKKEYDQDLTWEEATEAANNLVGFFEILVEIEIDDQKRQKKLKKYPKGFHLNDGTYSCCICRQSISNKDTWYDKNGIKCLHCQKAVDKRIIPKSVCKNDKLWYAMWEFDYYFKIKHQTISKFVRQGKLKSRIIKNKDTNHKYHEIFLIKDNKNILPNKPESYRVTDDKGMIHIEYKKVDISKLIMKDDNEKISRKIKK